MNPEHAFESWAPEGSIWSPWAKPILFAALADGRAFPTDIVLPRAGVAWAPDPRSRAAVVVDLPGPDAVLVGLALAAAGYRPVPLFNGCDGPGALIDVDEILRRLVLGIEELRRAALPGDAPPAFLLDARRRQGAPSPGVFDNRWVVLPQDFPSASRLLDAGVRSALLVSLRERQPAEDLAHALLRWQDAGIAIESVDLHAATPRPEPIRVEKPPRFRSAVHSVLALVGLRRGSAGGFGALIPVPPPPGTVSGFH